MSAQILCDLHRQLASCVDARRRLCPMAPGLWITSGGRR